MLKVTTSWDDGDILDKKLADLLTKYGIKGTFYITKVYRPERLSESEIKTLSETHEIGAHTLTHPDLRVLTQEKLQEEIVGSKKWLEEVTQKPVTMFCYTKGQYTPEVAKKVEENGFLGARSTILGSLISGKKFHLETTIQVYPFPFRKIDKQRYYFGKILQPYLQRAKGLQKIGVPITAMHSWLSSSKAAFDYALKHGEVFHVWGHSWEIEKYGMWNEFEKLLQYISKRSDCEYVVNGDLVKN
ncbi:MAG TPA: polysaccharide deacetylase family protein [Candidatus Nanoarchaeia archaeon]|nr:polysaccharide deacetylase family protein [Candidatus Nanoarchaeia archaeon]